VRTLAALLVLACVTGAAPAADPAWPPAPETQARIEVLRHTIGDASTTADERRAARDELARLLMHPGATASPAVKAMPPRAAVDLLPPAARLAVPATPAPPRPTPVAPPPDRANIPIPDPRGGGVVVPSGKNVIDPKTGALLIDTGNGWVDPATGRFVPKN